MKNSICFTLLFLCIATVRSTAQTVGVTKHTGKSLDQGYVLFAPLNTTETYLIDKCGRLIRSWHSASPPGLAAYLLPDGSLLRASSTTGGNQDGTSTIERISWDGVVTWSYLYQTAEGAHHDIEPMPNGNVLIISHESHPAQDVIDLGRDPAITNTDKPFLSEQIVEVKPIGADNGEVVWKWRPFDHLIQDHDSTKPGFGGVAKHPELIDINFPAVTAGEWQHMNSVKYNDSLDQIVLSNRFSSEIWIVDHSTSTAEAASHTGGHCGKGGDLLYRWGNPIAYKRGTLADQRLFAQHDPWWIPSGHPHAGEMTVFDNGVGRRGLAFSSVDRIVLPLEPNGTYRIDTLDVVDTLPFLPLTASWMCLDTLAGETIYSSAMGGGQILENGNLLFSSSIWGEIYEFDSNMVQVWKYVNPVKGTTFQKQGDIAAKFPFFKARFYPASYPAFTGKSMTPGAVLELGPLTFPCDLNPPNAVAEQPVQPMEELFAYPNPAADHLVISTASTVESMRLYNVLGALAAECVNGSRLNTSTVPNGIYSLVVRSGRNTVVKTISVMR